MNPFVPWEEHEKNRTVLSVGRGRTVRGLLLGQGMGGVSSVLLKRVVAAEKVSIIRAIIAASRGRRLLSSVGMPFLSSEGPRSSGIRGGPVCGGQGGVRPSRKKEMLIGERRNPLVGGVSSWWDTEEKRRPRKVPQLRPDSDKEKAPLGCENAEKEKASYDEEIDMR